MAEVPLPNGSASTTVNNTNSANDATNSDGISSDEIALYDRQIRLWGVQAQERLRHSDVLLIGMRGLGNEIAKNLVLAGVRSLTMVDDNPVTEDDLGAQFMIGTENIGQIRSQACLQYTQSLNPRVNVSVSPLAPLLADASLFRFYSIVIATDQTLSFLSSLNIICRTQERPFYASSTFGLYGFIFADLITHTFTLTREKSNIPTRIGPESPTRSIISFSIAPRNSEGKVNEIVTKREVYCPINLANTSPLPAFHLSNARRKLAVSPLLSCIRALWEYQGITSSYLPTGTPQDLALFTQLAKQKHAELQLPLETLRGDVVKSFCQNLNTEISPVCSILGARLSQDVINVLSGKEQPIQNFCIFDGEDLKGPIYCLWTDMQQALRDAGVAPAVAAGGNGDAATAATEGATNGTETAQ